MGRKRCRQDTGTYTGDDWTAGAPRIDHLLVDGGEVLWYCTEERIPWFLHVGSPAGVHR